MIQLRFLDEAADEIVDTLKWYRERSEGAEKSYLRQLNEALQHIRDAPLRFPRYTENTRRYVFPLFPYSVIYLIEENVIAIVALPHDKQKPGYWLERLRS